MSEQFCFGCCSGAVFVRFGAGGEQERGHVRVQGFACPGVAVGSGVDGAAEQGPSVTVVFIDVVAVVEKVAQAVQVLV